MKRIACLLAMLAVVSLGAFAQFDHPINVSNTPNTPSMWPQVAFGADGILHIVWAEYWTGSNSDILYATYDGTTISTPIKLSNPGPKLCYFPFIAVGTKGKIAVIWGQYDEHWMNIYDPVAKAWGGAQMIGDLNTGSGFLSRPKVAIDPDGNVFAFYFKQMGGKIFSRANINGVWEPQKLLNGGYAKEGGICAAPDGRVYACFDAKMEGGYKVVFKWRTKNTDWSGPYLIKLGNEQAQPYLGVGSAPDSIPYLSYLGSTSREGSNYINIATIDLNTNPAVAVVGPSAYHYPRVAVDDLGFPHIASQFGQGDHGLGIVYFTKESGEWKGGGILPDSQGEPKLPGIASDLFGNIAVSYDSFTNGTKEAYFVTRYPVVIRRFEPPLNPAVTITASGFMMSAPSVTYNLSWEKNPDNNDAYIQGYRIYRSVGGGTPHLVIEVSKDTLSYQLTYTSASDLAQKSQFFISTVTLGGNEGDKVSF